MSSAQVLSARLRAECLLKWTHLCFISTDNLCLLRAPSPNPRLISRVRQNRELDIQQLLPEVKTHKTHSIEKVILNDDT